MERTLGHDLSQVRVHPNSPRADAVGARAFAQGTDLHVAPGQFQPGTSQGRRLLGHELTHIAQQAEGRVRATRTVNGVAVNDDPTLEREADLLGARANQDLHSQGSDPMPARSGAAIGQRSVVIQGEYLIKHPETGRMVDLDHPRWTIESLTSLLGKLSTSEQKEHAARIRERMGRLQGTQVQPYPAPVASSSASSSPTAGMSERDKVLLSGVRATERLAKAASFAPSASELARDPLAAASVPGQIAEMAMSDESQPLLEESGPLARWKVEQAKRLGGVTGGGMAANKAAELGSQVVGHSLGPVAAATGGALNTAHTASQAARLASTSSSNSEVQSDISHLASGRAKKAVSQVGKTASAAVVGTSIGAGVGTAIPVPVLGTLVGALVGGLAGFTVGKVTELLGDTALQDPGADYEAVLRLHFAALGGDEAALAVFVQLGVSEEVARAYDGWKALAKKVGAKPR